MKGSHLVIYNKAFDIGFIEAEYRLLDKNIHLENYCSQITCAMEFAKQVFGVNRISLNAACKRYKIDVSSRQVHGAYVDADLTAQLYYRLIDKTVKPLTSTPQSRPHKIPKAVAIPRAFKHPETNELVQLNFCKNADCRNFGVPARNAKRKADGTPRRGLGNEYKLTHNKDGSHSLTCTLCNQSSALINNRAYVQESLRVQRTQVPTEPSCPNVDDNCENVGQGIYSHPELYKKNGFTRKTRH